MKSFSICAVVALAVLSAMGSTIELQYPTDGTVITINQNFTAQVVLPFSMASCIDVGIALAIHSCTNDVCPEPTQGLGSVLYAGAWNPTILEPGVGFYQNFTFQVDQYEPTGPAIFTLTHCCLAGADPIPYLEYRNATVTVVA